MLLKLRHMMVRRHSLKIACAIINRFCVSQINCEGPWTHGLVQHVFGTIHPLKSVSSRVGQYTSIR